MLDEPPDPELERLVTALCDERLSEADLRKLEDRLSTDPAALSYCADRIRFESELSDIICPPPNLQWSEKRRLLRDNGKGWELRLERSLYFPSSGKPRLVNGLRRFLASRKMYGVLWILGAVVLAALFWTVSRPARAPQPATSATSPIECKNGDFEITKLDHTQSGEASALLGWSDYFPSAHATLVEIGKQSNNQILARSGRNVARVQEGGYLTQKLARKDGSPVLATPGLRIRVSGWAYVESDVSELTFTLALRFVASPYPEMIQYEPEFEEVMITEGDWRHFSRVLELPAELTVNRVTKSDDLPFPPSMDIAGKDLTFSVDNRTGSGGDLLLDDLTIQECTAEHGFRNE